VFEFSWLAQIEQLTESLKLLRFQNCSFHDLRIAGKQKDKFKKEAQPPFTSLANGATHHQPARWRLVISNKIEYTVWL
jgi:hypothetical protein